MLLWSHNIAKCTALCSRGSICASGGVQDKRPVFCQRPAAHAWRIGEDLAARLVGGHKSRHKTATAKQVELVKLKCIGMYFFYFLASVSRGLTSRRLWSLIKTLALPVFSRITYLISHKMATPRSTQWSGFFIVGIHNGVINVKSVRTGFLYTGHWK